MSFIPSHVLSKLYNRTSLRNASEGVQFSVKNRLSPASLRKVTRVEIDNRPIDLDRVTVVLEGGSPFAVGQITAKKPIDFPLGNCCSRTDGTSCLWCLTRSLSAN